ncbi:DoxX family protein [Nocardia cyriacigeorgica]|uniref:DoxX family membrane protein n=1 Tax=Nocardia cyriacigeorgica TaxID=135487 RepID=A0A5R8NA12_9NOCA|nr:hypothetical protein [Nocardia cyriacigeorgica]TLF72551.1 hypothetical protein FEK34_28865 [Nocardia cyriacigeorgica]
MFDTLLLLLVPTLACRLLGRFGVTQFTAWTVCLAHGLAVMLLFTGAAHFLPDSVEAMPSHADLTAMVPPYLPFPGVLVYVTGVLELLGAAALVIASTRAVAGVGLALLFVVMLPANVYAAMESVPLNGDPATPLWFRIPEQIAFIAVALIAVAAAPDGPVRRALLGVVRRRSPRAAVSG